MSAIAKRAHRRVDALERAAKLVEKFRKDALKADINLRSGRRRIHEPTRRGDSIRQCASELQEALEGV